MTILEKEPAEDSSYRLKRLYRFLRQDPRNRSGLESILTLPQKATAVTSPTVRCEAPVGAVDLYFYPEAVSLELPTPAETYYSYPLGSRINHWMAITVSLCLDTMGVATKIQIVDRCLGLHG